MGIFGGVLVFFSSSRSQLHAEGRPHCPTTPSPEASRSGTGPPRLRQALGAATAPRLSPGGSGEAHAVEGHHHGPAEAQVVLQRDLCPGDLPPPGQAAQLPAEFGALRQA